MKSLMIGVLVLVSTLACGREDDEDQKIEKKMDVEILQLTTNMDTYSNKVGTTLSIDWVYNGDSLVTQGWHTTAVVIPGKKAPENCTDELDDSEVKTDWVILQFKNLTNGSFYSFRACAFDPERNYYSAGLTKTVKTPVAVEYEVDVVEDE